MHNSELLDEQVVVQRGCFQRIRRWWRGIHSEKGSIIMGLTGWETVEETDRIVPSHTFNVSNEGVHYWHRNL